VNKFFLWLGISLSLAGCTFISDNYAPVIDVNTIETIPKAGLYRVKTDDTLYSIAWRYGLDYKSLAAWNHIPPPYAIKIDQLLSLKPVKTHKIQKTLSSSAKSTAPTTTPVVTTKEPSVAVALWLWPANGHVIGKFSSQNKGINIGGKLGDPIYATAPGKVVYSGEGLRGYGKLIILKHNATYLSAYAHNDTILVQNGDWITAGQKIAEMGKTGTQKIMLHFEIRRQGKPVNPLIYLQSKK